MKLISNDEYVLDVCTELDEKNRQFFLLLKRTAWIHPLRLDNSLYIDVMFFQVVPDYLEGLLIVMRTEDSVSAAVMDDIARLGALLHYADDDSAEHGQQHRHDVNARQVVELLPRTVDNLRHVTADQWTARVNGKLAELPAAMTCRQARAAFLQVLQQWPLFGSTFFYIHHVNDARVQQECLLAINRYGVQFLHMVTHVSALPIRCHSAANAARPASGRGAEHAQGHRRAPRPTDALPGHQCRRSRAHEGAGDDRAADRPGHGDLASARPVHLRRRAEPRRDHREGVIFNLRLHEYGEWSFGMISFGATTRTHDDGIAVDHFAG